MTDEKKKMTAQDSSVGADDGQSISQNSKTTIPDPDEKSNSPERDLEELYRKMRRMSDPAYLHTVTLDELMDNVFEGKSAVIENLLYTGAYILAGAPKIGKSFLVAQIAHHVSTGQDLWGYKVHQGTVLEDREYNIKDYDKNLVLEKRTELVAKRVSDFLKKNNSRFAKTIFFCVDIDHAARMAQALRNENGDLVRQNPKYVVQMTSGSEGVKELENFMTADEPYPVLVTTSKLLTTGVDADTVKFIVLDSKNDIR